MPDRKRSPFQAESFGEFLGLIAEDVISGNALKGFTEATKKGIAIRADKRSTQDTTAVDTSVLGPPAPTNVEAAQIEPTSISTEELSVALSDTPTPEQQVNAQDALADNVTGLGGSVQAIETVGPDPFVIPPTPKIGKEVFEPKERTEFLANVLGPDRLEQDTVDAEQKIGFFKSAAFKVGTDPILQDQLAQIAQALSAGSPSSFGFQLGGALRESAQGQQFEIAKQAAIDQLAGREPIVDPNTLTLGPETRQAAVTSAVSEITTALGLEATQIGIPSEQQEELAFNIDQARFVIESQKIKTDAERFQLFNLNEAQIQGVAALQQERIIETQIKLQKLDTEITSQHQGIIREIGKNANVIAAKAAGITGLTESTDGAITYQFENPKLYTDTYNEIRNQELAQSITRGSLPKAVSTLMSGGDKEVAIAFRPQADKAMLSKFPEAVFLGTKTIGNLLQYFYDTNGDGEADQSFRLGL